MQIDFISRQSVYRFGGLIILRMSSHNTKIGYNFVLNLIKQEDFGYRQIRDIIRRNPFDFKLVDVVPNDSQKRIAMTEDFSPVAFYRCISKNFCLIMICFCRKSEYH